MNHPAQTEQFVRQLTENQNRLYGYVYSLLGDHSRASDVVQETNMVLWRKVDEFQADKPFLPWAFSVARYQVLAHLRDHKRDRFLLDSELVAKIAEESEEQADQLELLREKLRPCLGLLTPGNRQLIEWRYFRAMSMDAVADAADRSVGAVKVALLRIRRQLSECVEQRIASEG